MTDRPASSHVETLVIGGGQSGLAVGYHLSRRGLSYAIIDANDRIGDAWRNRWDSLRLFTPNRLNGLPGMPFPGYHWGFPSKDEMADYLESYARRFDIPVETGVRVRRLSREGDRFVAAAGNRRFEADNVVVAMSSWHDPGSRSSPASSIRALSSFMSPTTATPVSSKPEVSWWLEPVIRGRRSPRSWREPTASGCPDPTPVASHSARRAWLHESSCRSSRGSSSTEF